MKILFSVKLFFFVLFLINTSCKKRSDFDFTNVSSSDISVKGLCKVDRFGSNPGNLEMYKYIPEHLDTNPACVIVLHGCTQNVEEVLHDTEWDKLAEKYGFILLLPETKRTNNVQKCFNWFDTGDQKKGSGEPASIIQMLDVLTKNYSISNKKVFVTGLSAGGAMATIIMAIYPERIKAGAVMAGGAFKAAENVFQAQKAMNGKVIKTGEEWGNLIKNENNIGIKYPKIAIFHGEKDKTVDPQNAEEIIKQWANLHQAKSLNYIGVPYLPGNKGVIEYEYVNSNNEKVIKYYLILGLGHQLSVDPGNARAQGGQENKYSIDKDFYSPYWAARFFGLIP